MSLHAFLGVVVVAVAVVGALLAALVRNRPAAVPAVRVFVRLCGAAAAVQAVVGLVLLIAGERPAEWIHLFYGAATVAPIPIAEAYGRRSRLRNQAMPLLIGSAATALFGLRAVTTGNT